MEDIYIFKGLNLRAKIFLQRSGTIQSWQLIYSLSTPLSKSLYKFIHRLYFSLTILEVNAEQTGLSFSKRCTWNKLTSLLSLSKTLMFVTLGFEAK